VRVYYPNVEELGELAGTPAALTKLTASTTLGNLAEVNTNNRELTNNRGKSIVLYTDESGIALIQIKSDEPGKANIKVWSQAISDLLNMLSGNENIAYLVMNQTTIDIVTTSKTGYVEITSDPSNAELYIDGKYMGTTPKTIELNEGSHEVKISKDGYYDYTETVYVSAGETISLYAKLRMIPVTTAPTTTVTTIPTTVTTATVTPVPQSSTPLWIGFILMLMVLGGVFLIRSREKPKHSIPDFPKVLLSKYQPLEFIGEGGFARVFKCKRNDGKIVAVKIPKITSERMRRSFIKEMAVWLNLNHPNIVKLFDADYIPIEHLEMEFVEGVNLKGKIIRDLENYPKPVKEDLALKLIKGIALGLSHAHSKNFVHRDLKPLNILLKSNLTPKITDWGLAKLALTSGSSKLGYTPLYASPEQVMPSKYGKTDERTDIYQLGLIFYELLTGRLPYEGYTEQEIIGKITDEKYVPKPPSHHNSSLSKYDGIIMKMIAKRKELRYQSVDEFIKDLDKIQEIEKLKESLKKSKERLKKSKSREEIDKNKRIVVETLVKYAVMLAELESAFGELELRRELKLDGIVELISILEDLKLYTTQHLDDLLKALEELEFRLKSGWSVDKDYTNRLKVLLNRILKEFR